MPPIRILLADDNITFRHGLRKLLESDARVEVVAEVGDGIAVVEQAKGRRPDVVLMDIRMPGQDGLAAAREIRKHCPGVKIVVLTSYDTPALRAQAREAGVSAYLLKAEDAESLLAVVATTKTPSPAHLEILLPI